MRMTARCRCRPPPRSNTDTALALVGVGTGLAAVPDYGRLFAPNFDVRFIKLRAPEIRRRYYIYQRRGLVLSPPAEAFVKLLRSAARSDG